MSFWIASSCSSFSIRAVKAAISVMWLSSPQFVSIAYINARGKRPACLPLESIIREDCRARRVERDARHLLVKLLSTGGGLQVDQIGVNRVGVRRLELIVPARHAIREQRAVEHDLVECLVRAGLHATQIRRDGSVLIRVAQDTIVEE